MINLNIVGIHKSSITQLIRYGLVGIASNLIGYTVYLLIVYLGVNPKVTMTFLYGVSATIGYFGNRKLTFNYDGSLHGSGARYVLAHSIGYLINLLLLIIFVDKLGFAHQWVQAAAIFIVAGFLFIAFKFFVFTEPKATTLEKS